MRTAVHLVALALAVPAAAVLSGSAGERSAPVRAGDAAPEEINLLLRAHHSFYNARYDDAAAEALEVRASHPEDLAAYELRTSALLFQLKDALGDHAEKDRAFTACARCPEWLEAFLSDTARGQALARARIEADASDDAALFFLGKLDLNYVWLQLGPLGRRRGWSEYREARRSLDAVLKRNPQHVRARVARAWMEYIVATRMPRGTAWLFGGGNRKKALTVVRAAATTEADFFARAEAAFALWEMEVRERNFDEAVAVARGLHNSFPDNRRLAAFLAVHESP
jgi:hypothetical protein